MAHPSSCRSPGSAEPGACTSMPTGRSLSPWTHGANRWHRGSSSHSSLLTNLVNRVQPIIRYDLGDRVRMDGIPCSCGSGLPTVEVQGRQDDALVMAGRDGGSVTLLPMALTTVLEEEADVFDFQLRQKDERTLILRLSCTGAEAGRVLDRCRRALSALAQSQAMAPIELLGELGKPPGRGRSGKVQRIVARART